MDGAEFIEEVDVGEYSALKPHGFVEIADPDAPGGIIAGETLQCVHCGGHWMIQPGSGKLRGFCLRCNGPICGPGCAECRPIDLQLERMEASALGESDRAKVSAAVPKLWTPG